MMTNNIFNKKISYHNYNEGVNFLENMKMKIGFDYRWSDLQRGSYFKNIIFKWPIIPNSHWSSRYLYDCVTSDDDKIPIEVKSYDRNTNILELEFFSDSCDTAFKFLEFDHNCACDCHSEIVYGNKLWNVNPTIAFTMTKELCNECQLELFAKHPDNSRELIFTLSLYPTPWVGEVSINQKIDKIGHLNGGLLVPVEIDVNAELMLCQDNTMDCNNPVKKDILNVNKGQTIILKMTCDECPETTVLTGTNYTKWSKGSGFLVDLGNYVEEDKYEGKTGVIKFHFPIADELDIGELGEFYWSANSVTPFSQEDVDKFQNRRLNFVFRRLSEKKNTKTGKQSVDFRSNCDVGCVVLMFLGCIILLSIIYTIWRCYKLKTEKRAEAIKSKQDYELRKLELESNNNNNNSNQNTIPKAVAVKGKYTVAVEDS